MMLLANHWACADMSTESPSIPPTGSIGGLLQPALWMLTATLLFAMGNATIRHITDSLPSLEIVFLRNLLCVVLLLPWILTRGAAACRAVVTGGRLGLFASRSAVNVAAMIAWYYSLAHIPLPTATAVSFTTPLFVTLGAALFFGERLRSHRLAAIALGLTGVVIVLKPDGGGIDASFAVLLLHCVAAAATLLMTRRLTRDDSVLVVVLFLSLFSAPLAALPALAMPSHAAWIWPSWSAWGWLFLLSGALTLAQLAMTRALSMAPAPAVMPYDYARLPFSAVIAWIAFGEAMDLRGWIGAALIVAAALFTMHRDASHARRPSAVNARSQAHRQAA